MNPATVHVLRCMYAELVQKILVVAVSKVEVQVLMMVQVVLVVSAGIQGSKIQLQNRKKVRSKNNFTYLRNEVWSVVQVLRLHHISDEYQPNGPYPR